MQTGTLTGGVLAACVLLGTAATCPAQSTYPSKPIRFITPYAAGGSTSVLARMLGQKMTETWGHQVVVESRGGANTIIGSDIVAKSPPDGYTLLLAAPSLVINASLYSKLPYDPINDFAAVAAVTRIEYLLVTHPSVPVSNVKQLIALARSRPGQLNYASTGPSMQVVSELFNMLAATRIQQVPYKGGGPAVVDLIGGQVHMMFAIPTNVIGHVKSARLKPVAITGRRRLTSLPDVPTFDESGLPGYNATAWYGVVVPAGTPRDLIDRLAAEINRMLALPDMKEKFDAQGFSPYVMTTDEFAALIRADKAKYAQVVKAANIRID
jgi:tripartite-type tricarboxylate transporter receptor subunit TctC